MDVMTAFLGLLKYLIPAYELPAEPKDIERILVIDFAYLGDMIMTSPLYRALKKHYPDASVDAFVFPAGREVLRMNPYVDQVYVHRPGPALIDLSTISRLRRKKYDLGIQMNTSLRNNFILWLIHPLLRLGYD